MEIGTCRVCDYTGEVQNYTAREMMFGWKDSFSYFQCPSCETLQIRNVPTDLSRFYPDNYGAYNVAFTRKPHKDGIRNRIRIWRNRLYLDQRRIYSLFLKKVFPFYEDIPAFFEGVKIDSRTKILDVGCGDGDLLLKLASIGFRNLTGVEPFQKDPVKSFGGVRIVNCRLEQMQGQFDFIMLHHVLEHMPNPHSALQSIHRLLPAGGVCLLRIPTVSSYAWKEYGVDWVQLDAPRHLYLFSMKSIEYLASRYGFRTINKIWDSTEFQIWGSEQYRRNIPLMSKVGFGKGWFQPASKELEEIALLGKAVAEELNRTSRGDQIQLLLRRED